MPEQPQTTPPAQPLPPLPASVDGKELPVDVVDQLAGLSQTESARLRSHRPDVVRHAQGSYDAIFPAGAAPDSVPTFGVPLRLFAAARAAQVEAQPRAESHYLGRLSETDGRLVALLQGDAAASASAKERAILGHVELLSQRPGAATRQDLVALQEAGLADDDIVMLSQTVSFVAFQLRLAQGLAVLQELTLAEEQP